MITYSVKGDWSKTNTFLQRALRIIKLSDLDKFGQKGVDMLRASTPKDSGKTASSWYYRIRNVKTGVAIEWFNSSLKDGIPIVILLQYGHGLRQGGYVKGVDFIKPALKPVFDELAEKAWKEFTNG